MSGNDCSEGTCAYRMEKGVLIVQSEDKYNGFHEAFILNGKDTWSSHSETFLIRCAIGLIKGDLGSRTDISRCRDVSRQLPLVHTGGSNLSLPRSCGGVCVRQF